MSDEERGASCEARGAKSNAASRAKQQRRFDYDAEQRERRQLIWAISFERTGLGSRRTWGNVQALLIFLVNCDRGSGTIPYVETIATQLNWSRRTVDRTIAAAKQLGVLQAETRKNKRGRTSNSWTIDFAALASLGAPPSGVNPRQNGVNPRQNGVNPRQNGVNPIKRNYYYPTTVEITSSSSGPRPSTLDPRPFPSPRPSGEERGARSEAEDDEEDEEILQRWQAAIPFANRLLRVLAPGGINTLSVERREWIAKLALLAVEFGPAWIEPAFEQLRFSTPRNPQALVASMLDGECQRLGTRLHRELARVRLPAKREEPVARSE